MEGKFQGKCELMCSKGEIALRQEAQKLSRFEILPNSSTQVKGRTLHEADPSRMVKEYKSRSLRVDSKADLAGEVRTLDTLIKTVNYLVGEILEADRRTEASLSKPASLSLAFSDVHEFLLDRFKAIRQDLSYYDIDQRSSHKGVVEIYEVIIRFHILSIKEDLHFDKFIAHDNKCSLWVALKDYLEIYSHRMSQGAPLEGGEFLKYALLFHHEDELYLNQILSDFTNTAKTTNSQSDYTDKQVGEALQVILLARSGNIYALRKELLKQSYLTRCIAMPIINSARRRVCASFNSGLKKLSNYSKAEFFELMLLDQPEEGESTLVSDYFRALGIEIGSESNPNQFSVKFSNPRIEQADEHVRRGLGCELLFKGAKELVLERRKILYNIL